MAGDVEETEPDPGRAPGWRSFWAVRRAYTWVGVVLLVGALVTAALALVSAELAASNEQHLLKLRSKEVASALTAALPDTQTPLGAAVALADVTGGDQAKFTSFADRYVGAHGPFLSISVWRVADLAAGPIAVAGATPELPSVPGGVAGFLRHASTSTLLSVTGLLHAAQPRLGYAYTGSSSSAFIVYAEAALPAHGFTRLPPNSAYSNLDVSVYLGTGTRPSELLLTTVRHLPLPGKHAEARVTFGSTKLSIVVSASQPLGGSFPQKLPWGIAIVGSLLTIAAAFLIGRLILDGRRAQRLAQENNRLYAEQRGVAQTLQHALLPDVLPDLDGVELAVRYDAGVAGIDIGGDWYDLIELGDDKLLLVIGDVSGRGLRAATAMAALRFAIRYASQSESPEEFMPKLSGMPSLRTGNQLATVLCAVVDLRTRKLQVTSAGHLPLLQVYDGRAEFLEAEVGLPIGVQRDAAYATSSFTIPPGATLLGYTDGLVERRSETLDAGLERLSKVATELDGTLSELMAGLVERVRDPNSGDDIAIAGIRWPE